MARSTAHRHVQELLPILQTTLDRLGYLPTRSYAKASEVKASCEALDNLLIDATERRYHRPSEDALQRHYYSGKQKHHTVKNTVMATSPKHIIYLGQTFGGCRHDYGMFKEEFPPEQAWFEGIHIYVDAGYQGMATDYTQAKVEIPHKKERKRKNHPQPTLSDEQKAPNQAVGKARIYVENAIAGIKRFQILVHRFRQRLEGMVDTVMALCAGLWNALLDT